MGSPGEEATREAIKSNKPMTVYEYARAQRAWRQTKKRIERNKAPRRVGGFHKVGIIPQGSFGDVDYG